MNINHTEVDCVSYAGVASEKKIDVAAIFLPLIFFVAEFQPMADTREGTRRLDMLFYIMDLNFQFTYATRFSQYKKAMNYMKSLGCIWQSMITGSTEFKGSYCLKVAPMIFDMVKSNSKEGWEKGAPGSHLELLAHLILILPPQCVDMLPESYRRFIMRKDIRYEKGQLDFIKWRKENEEERKERLLKEFREEYYRKHFINLRDVPNLTMNYMKCLRSIWQSIIAGSAEFKGSYCLRFALLIFDMVMSNSKECWESGAPGSHLEPLADLILIIPPQCIDMLPERYRRFRMRKDVLKLYGEGLKGNKENRKPECDIDTILESLRREGLQSTLKVEEENGRNEATGTLRFPSFDGMISENVIRSDEAVPTTIKEPSLRPFKLTLHNGAGVLKDRCLFIGLYLLLCNVVFL